MADFNDVIIAAKVLSNDNVSIRLVEDAGGIAYPTFLWKQNKLLMSDLVDGETETAHPAFIINGTEIDGFELSLYQNCIINNLALSLPFKDPASTITMTAMQNAIANNGNGYHITTNAEWAAIALWCKKNGFYPRGNNNYGSDANYPLEKGTPASFDSATGKTLHTYTGSGPISWNHNNQPFGISDLNGNVYEACSGWRTMRGELQIIPNNDAAAIGADTSATSALWKAILPDGTLVAPGTDGTLKYNFSGTTPKLDTVISTRASGSVSFASFAAASGVAVPDVLKRLALFPYDAGGDYGSDTMYINNADNTTEYIAARGGNYSYSASSAGVFYLYGNSTRGNAIHFLGFRSAFVNLESD